MSIRLPGNFNVESLKPQTRRDFVISVEAPDARAEIPLVVLRGESSHPRVILVAGVHGDEFDGVDALLSAISQLEGGRLQGTVMAVPVANPPALVACSRVSPVDGLNLNRVFPGREDGTLSERIAHMLIERVFRGADFVYSLHGASAYGILRPWVEFQYVESPTGLASYRAALQSAFDHIYPIPHGLAPGLLLSACHDIGVPAIEGERGGMGIVRVAESTDYEFSILRLLQHFGVITLPEGFLDLGIDAATPPRPEDHVDVIAGRGGFWASWVDVGERVKGGQQLGVVIDFYGNPVEEVFAPAPGPVVMLRTRPTCAEGDRLTVIGRPMRLSKYFTRGIAGGVGPAKDVLPARGGP